MLPERSSCSNNVEKVAEFAPSQRQHSRKRPCVFKKVASKNGKKNTACRDMQRLKAPCGERNIMKPLTMTKCNRALRGRNTDAKGVCSHRVSLLQIVGICKLQTVYQVGSHWSYSFFLVQRCWESLVVWYLSHKWPRHPKDSSCTDLCWSLSHKSSASDVLMDLPWRSSTKWA